MWAYQPMLNSEANPMRSMSVHFLCRDINRTPTAIQAQKVTPRSYITASMHLCFPSKAMIKWLFPYQNLWPLVNHVYLQPTPVFLPGEFHGQRRLVGYSPGGHKESNTTVWLERERDAKSKTMMRCKGKYKQILEISIHKSRKLFVILLLTSI